MNPRGVTAATIGLHLLGPFDNAGRREGRRGAHVERERRQGGDRSVPAHEREWPGRGPHVCDGARRRPRRGECHRPALAPVRVRRESRVQSGIAGCRGGRGGPRRRSSRSSPRCRSRRNAVAAGIANADSAYAAALAAIPEGAAKANGVAVGQAAAAAIVALRAGDGSDAPWSDFTTIRRGPSPVNGASRPTSRCRPWRSRPNWGEVTPFVLQRGSQFRPQAPYHLRSRKYAADYNEIKLLGGDDITTPSARTPDQTEIGLFWIESSPLAWNRLARALSVSEGLDLWENARLFGLLNLAMADGYIASWEAKYHYNFWRPITAIRLGDTDGNPRYGRACRTGLHCNSPIRCRITTPGTRCKAASRRRS